MDSHAEISSRPATAQTASQNHTTGQMHMAIGWLRFNGIFSTTGLYVCSSFVKRLILVRNFFNIMQKIKKVKSEKR